MKFTVDRRTWYRGKGSSSSVLLNDDDMRCCIGFVAEQCGIPDEKLANLKSLHSCTKNLEYIEPTTFPRWMNSVKSQGYASSDLMEAYQTNDNRMINDDAREKQLIAIFARNGDELEFIN